MPQAFAPLLLGKWNRDQVASCTLNASRMQSKALAKKCCREQKVVQVLKSNFVDELETAYAESVFKAGCRVKGDWLGTLETWLCHEHGMRSLTLPIWILFIKRPELSYMISVD